MKVILFRLGVLGALIVLGWITMANAQRGSDNANPLRSPAPPMENSAPPASPLRPADSIPDASTVGLSSSNDPAPPRNLAPPSREPPLVVSTSAEQPSIGPALISGSGNQPGGDRYTAPTASRYDTGNRGGDRYSSNSTPPVNTPAASDSREPPPLRVDPLAMPARPASNDSGNLLPPTNALRRSPPEQSPVDTRGFAQPVPSGVPSFGAPAGEGCGQPGDPRLEGAQSPQLTIQKSAPKEIQVGKPATFRVTVRNTGSIPACDVEVCDQVPKGTQLLETTPQAKRGAHGELVWAVGTIRPGEEAEVKMQLMPTAEGEIGSVATVRFGADASARSIATRPQLVVAGAAPKKVMIGDQVTLSITISNPGTGVATGVVLEEHIPPGLRHPAGTELEYQVGDLKPGESRKLDLPMAAIRAGMATNVLGAHGDGSLRAEENKCDLEVVAPQLTVAVDGPKRRYLERQAKYEFSVSNPGTASARQVELIASLPQGLKFVSANNAGYYEESTRTVRWRLEELPADGQPGSVELVTLPVEAGQYAIKLRGTAQKGLIAEKEHPVLVEGIAAILFQVSSTAGPIEIGGETTYEVHVMNQGSKAAANVRLAVDLPPELKLVGAEGPVRYGLSGNQVIFEGLGQLAPKADTIYRVRVKALRPGDLRARFQLQTDDMQSPVTKEENTRVFGDE
jgi:uncharacterized repeat protein (TIGR01451 family)